MLLGVAFSILLLFSTAIGPSCCRQLTFQHFTNRSLDFQKMLAFPGARLLLWLNPVLALIDDTKWHLTARHFGRFCPSRHLYGLTKGRNRIMQTNIVQNELPRLIIIYFKTHFTEIVVQNPQAFSIEIRFFQYFLINNMPQLLVL